MAGQYRTTGHLDSDNRVTSQTDEDYEMSDQVEELLGSYGSDEHGEENDKDSAGNEHIDTEAGNSANPMPYIGFREVPRIVRYRELTIPGVGGNIVIGAADVAIPGQGVQTVSASAFLEWNDYAPSDAVDMDDSEEIGGFFESINAPYRVVSRAARRRPTYQEDAPDHNSVSGEMYIEGGDITIRAGWKTPLRNLTQEWRTRHGRAPSSAEANNLARLAKRALAVVTAAGAHGPTRDDERNWNTAQNLISFYITNGRGPDHSDPVAPVRGPETDALIRAAVSAVPPGSHGFFSSLASVVTTPVNVLAHAVTHPLQAVKDSAHAVTHPAATIQSIAHSTLVSNVMSAAKDVVRSKITGGALLGLSAIIPAVGVPALAAYTAANKALDTIDKAKDAINAGHDIVKKLGGGIPTAAQTAVIQKAQAAKTVHDSAVSAISKMQKLALAGDPKEATRAKILAIAKNARAAGAGQHGRFISDDGRILTGNFAPV